MNLKKITNEPNKLWCIFSTVIPKSAVEKLPIITLDKYNTLTNSQKSEINYSLEGMGIPTPITTEKIEAFLRGRPTGLQINDLAYIYEWFTECYEVNDLNLEVEYYYASAGGSYNYTHSEMTKLLIPKLVFYMDISTNSIAVNEKYIMGRWEKARGLDNPAYFGQSFPFYVGYKVLETGDYEVYIYTSYIGKIQIIKSNQEIFLVDKSGVVAQNMHTVKPVVDYSRMSVSYNENSQMPYNLEHFIGDISAGNFKYFSITNNKATQVSQVSIEITFKNNYTLTAPQDRDLKVVLFKNLNWEWAADEFSTQEVILKPSSYSAFPPELRGVSITINRSSIFFTLEKGTSFTFSSEYNIQYKAKASAITAF